MEEHPRLKISGRRQLPEKQSYSEEQVRDAAQILGSCGICFCVPGWYSLTSVEDVVRFAMDPAKFYDDLDKEHKASVLNACREKAAGLGTTLEEYLYYLGYANECNYMRYHIGEDLDLGTDSGRCAGVTSKGERCKNRVGFDGPFEKFKKGVSDMCSTHRPKRKSKTK